MNDLQDNRAAGITPIAGGFPVDENVVNVLPKYSRILSAIQFGTSTGTVTGRLQVRHPDGSTKQYFLKCATGSTGRRLLEGEFNSMSELHKTMPNFVPEPYAWGKYSSERPETYFFLSEFIEMSNRM